MTEQDRPDTDLLRRELIERGLLRQDTPENRKRIADELGCDEHDLDELLAALSGKRGLTLESLNQIRRADVDTVIKELQGIAMARHIPVGSLDGLKRAGAAILPELIVDAQLRWRQDSEALRQVRGERSFASWGGTGCWQSLSFWP